MTYLELSEDGGGSHKFYEVTVAGTQVTITHSSVYCFDASGERLWKLATGCGSA